MIRNAIESNPMIRDNPVARQQLEAMLSSPECLRQSMNPDFIRQSLQMQQAFAGMSPTNQTVSPELLQQLRGFMMSSPSPSAAAAAASPLAASQSSPQSLRARYTAQLQVLADMGFTDEGACIAGMLRW